MLPTTTNLFLLLSNQVLNCSTHLSYIGCTFSAPSNKKKLTITREGILQASEYIL